MRKKSEPKYRIRMKECLTGDPDPYVALWTMIVCMAAQDYLASVRGEYAVFSTVKPKDMKARCERFFFGDFARLSSIEPEEILGMIDRKAREERRKRIDEYEDAKRKFYGNKHGDLGRQDETGLPGSSGQNPAGRIHPDRSRV